MDTYVVIVIIFGIIALILLCLLFFINRLSILGKMVEDCFLSVESYIEQRAFIFEDMSSFLSKKLTQEQSLSKKIDSVRKSLLDVHGAIEGIDVLKKSDSVFSKFIHLDSLYDDLKNDKDYLKLKNSYQENQDRINYSIDSYDEGVSIYNKYKEKWLISFLSKVLRFPEYSYYKK